MSPSNCFISASSFLSLAWLTSIHLPFINDKPSVWPSRSRISSSVSGTPPTVSDGAICSTASKPRSEGFSSPIFTVIANALQRFFHQFGIRQRIPQFSNAGTSFKN